MIGLIGKKISGSRIKTAIKEIGGLEITSCAFISKIKQLEDKISIKPGQKMKISVVKTDAEKTTKWVLEH